jgi:hypothetical protein
MDARAFDKSRLHSRHAIEGPSRAPWWPHDEALGRVAGAIAPMQLVQAARRDVDAADGAPHPSGARVDGPRRPGNAVARDVCAIRRGDGGDLNAAWLPISDTTFAPTLEIVKSNRDQEVVGPVVHPISATGNAVGLQGARVPDGTLGSRAEVVGYADI